MSEYSTLPYHNSQPYVPSIPSSSTSISESDENDDMLEKEQVRLLEIGEDHEDFGKETYRNLYQENFHHHPQVGSTANAYVFSAVSWLSSHFPTRSEAKSNACSWLLTLLPSFLLPLLGRSTPRKLHPTSYLDGLRGIAALFVVFDHIKLTWYDRFGSIDLGYHSTPDPIQSSSFFQLPIIRILYNGQGMVAVFFVVSGYALSYKPLKLIRSRNSAALLDSAASMIFRRHMRLYLPLVFTTFISMCLVYVGAFPDQDPFKTPPRFPGDLKTQFWDWWNAYVFMVNPFRPVILSHGFGDANVYDRNLWTIPLEFRGSMVVFLSLIGLAKVRTTIRMLLITSLVLFCLYDAKWDLFLFLSGSLIADIHFSLNKQTLSSHPEEICPPISPTSPRSSWSLQWQNAKPILSSIFWLTSFLGSLYLVGFVNTNPRDSPGFKTLASLIPQNWSGDVFWKRFWSGNGAVLLVFSTGSAEFLQYPFTTSFVQYLGRISFSLYMIHWTLLHTLGEQMMPYFINAFGQMVGVVVWLVVFFGALFWVADLVMRGVDEKSVEFTRWVAGVCAAKSGDRV